MGALEDELSRRARQLLLKCGTRDHIHEHHSFLYLRVADYDLFLDDDGRLTTRTDTPPYTTVYCQDVDGNPVDDRSPIHICDLVLKLRQQMILEDLADV